jgi:hypothetical protein
VAEEHHVVNVLELNEVHDIGYVRIQVDLGRSEVHLLAEAGESGGVDIVAQNEVEAPYLVQAYRR